MLNLEDLKHWMHFASGYILGGRLQKISSYSVALVMEFYKQNEMYLVFLFSMNKGFLYLLKSHPQNLESKKKQLGILDSNFFNHKLQKPVELFINAHLKNQRIQEFFFPLKEERIIGIRFYQGELHFYLIPGRVNLFVTSNSKSMWLHKPKQILSDFVHKKQDVITVFNFEQEEERFLKDLKSLSWRPDSEKKKGVLFSKEEDLILKKNKIIDQIRSDLAVKKNKYQLFESIVATIYNPEMNQKNQILLKKLGFDWLGTYEDWIRIQEHFFSEQKKIKEKILKSENRIQELLNLPIENWQKQESQRLLISNWMKEKHISARSFIVNGFVVVYGKSGEDNLNLLRSSRPWDLWIHEQAVSGPHYILKRNQNQIVSDDVVVSACQMILKIQNQLEGDFIVTEVRYVRPIKGATPGQVQYQHEKRLRVVKE